MANSVRKSIEEVRKEERRTQLRLFFGIVVAGVILISLAFLLPLQGTPVTQTSYGDPAALSYGLPDYNIPNIAFSQQRTLPAMCVSNGSVQCAEPVIESFYVTNADTGISRYEQSVHMLLKNDGNSIRDVAVSLETGAALCGSSSTINIDSGATSERLDMLCINLADPNSFDGTWRVNYEENGVQKEVSGILKTTG